MKIPGRGLSRRPHAFHEANEAFLDHRGRQAVGVRLERIWSDDGFRVDRGASIVQIECSRKNARYEFLYVRGLQMNEMAGAIERKTVLPERPAQSADLALAFKDDGFAFRKVIAGAESSQPAANNDDLLHERISTFNSRYADRTPAKSVPTIVAAAHASVT